ncbi:isochorismatase family cysteine hydrolase [Paraburkholderia sp. BL25I1N1]|uniref:isochorismatase family cysteine hydrolase n=1 Tax=Paraburkholderia sp. BL25I1N1 TaxID=1938804 RepID=UPI000D05D2E3|nr:isochorismatase family cysteine hydrolase [Paraburkholderia sp. BL25I1N1]PRY04478.1 nicotinamidase-related amidase [Paraburkholderia sp. BL25I1N1]
MTTTTYGTDVSALILVDVLNDFLAADGKINPGIRDQMKEVNLIENLTRLIAGARAAGLQIAYAPHGLHEHSFDDVKYVPVRMQRAMEHHMFWMGEYGADFYEPFRPQAGDIVTGRHRTFNAFMGTDLDAQLKARGIEKVILAGLTSQTCVEGTGRHATEAGYHLTFLTDAVAEFTAEAHKAALEISYPTFGHEVLTVDTFLAAIRKPGE